MSKFKILYCIISIFQERSGFYSVYGQGIDAETENMELVSLGQFISLEDARDEAELKAAENDCVLVETIFGENPRAVHFNSELEKEMEANTNE